MGKWRLFVLLGVIGLLVFAPVMVGAYYSNVIGELRDVETNAIWQHGAAVEVYNCFSLEILVEEEVPAAPAADYGTFDIDISFIDTATPLCIEVWFTPGPEGAPAPDAAGPFANRSTSTGTLDAGTFWANRGPNAVTLTTFTTTSNVWLPAGIIAGIAFLSMGALSVRRRRV